MLFTPWRGVCAGQVRQPSRERIKWLISSGSASGGRAAWNHSTLDSHWRLVALAVVVIAFVLMQKRRTTSSAESSDRVRATRSTARRRATCGRELSDRVERVKQLHIQPLTLDHRDRFAEAWRSDQARFVDDPKGAWSKRTVSSRSDAGSRLPGRRLRAARGRRLGGSSARRAELSRRARHRGSRATRQASTEDLRVPWFTIARCSRTCSTPSSLNRGRPTDDRSQTPGRRTPVDRRPRGRERPRRGARRHTRSPAGTRERRRRQSARRARRRSAPARCSPGTRATTSVTAGPTSRRRSSTNRVRRSRTRTLWLLRQSNGWPRSSRRSARRWSSSGRRAGT